MKNHSHVDVVLAGLLVLVQFLLPLHIRGTAFNDPNGQQDDGGSTRPEPIKEMPPDSKRFALIIGVEQYADPLIAPVKGANRDARVLSDTLIQYAGFRESHVDVLSTDKPASRQPTRKNILSYISSLRHVMPADGLLLLSFAGHGVEKNSRSYLLPSDAKASGNPSVMEETAIRIDLVRELIKQIAPRQVILILDDRRSELLTGKANSAQPLTGSSIEGFKFDVGQDPVKAFAILYATGIGQRSYDDSRLQGGVFNQVLIEGLIGSAEPGQRSVTLAGLVKYLQEKVPRLASILKGPDISQQPFAFINGYDANQLDITQLPPGINEVKSGAAIGAIIGGISPTRPFPTSSASTGASTSTETETETKASAGVSRVTGNGNANTGRATGAAQSRATATTDPGAPPPPKSSSSNRNSSTSQSEAGRVRTNKRSSTARSAAGALMGTILSPAYAKLNATSGARQASLVEQAHWKMISRSRTPADFQAYLKLYPESPFAWLASSKYLALESRMTTTFRRFPTIQSPDEVEMNQWFGIQVLLTKGNLTPDVVVKESSSPGGIMALEVPIEVGQRSWKIDVMVWSPGFDLQNGANSASLTLEQDKDSTPAMFYLRPQLIKGGREARSIYVSFWHNGTRLGHAAKEIMITNKAVKSSSPPPPPPPSSSLETRGRRPMSLQPEPSAARQQSVAPLPLSSSGEAQPAPAMVIKPAQPSPDLTVEVKQDMYDKDRYMVTIKTTHDFKDGNPFKHDTYNKTDFRRKWLNTQYARLVPLSGRGAEPLQSNDDESASWTPQQEAKRFMQGFGRAVYSQMAPQAFKDAFWELFDERSKSQSKPFQSIVIYTDDPDIPWELMRPARDESSTESEDYLGTKYVMARLLISRSSEKKSSSPPSGSPPENKSLLPVDSIHVISPVYAGAAALPGQQAELDVLSVDLKRYYKRVPGKVRDLEIFFGDIQPGIIHFAGHGVVETKDEIDEFFIILEDERLNLFTWKGMLRNEHRRHPFIFFNACNVGANQRVANFINGWASEALNAGASGYIGALWPLGDKGAGEFGAAFYRLLLQRAKYGPISVGEVMRDTRKLFLEKNDPTFLAYIYYGKFDLQFILTGAH